MDSPSSSSAKAGNTPEQPTIGIHGQEDAEISVDGQGECGDQSCPNKERLPYPAGKLAGPGTKERDKRGKGRVRRGAGDIRQKERVKCGTKGKNREGTDSMKTERSEQEEKKTEGQDQTKEEELSTDGQMGQAKNYPYKTLLVHLAT
jgi:hypothetical protein